MVIFNSIQNKNMNYYLVVLKNYVKFDGRARRGEYWYFVLINLIIWFVLVFIGGTILVNIYSLAILLPSIAVAIRRMHDVGKSGWFILIPIYNLILAVSEGESGTNEYGEDPKRPGFENKIDEFGNN